MQTFLPYPDLDDTVRCLDYRRLGKQRVECKQILKALAIGTGGWVNHPACKMWRGYENALAMYMNFCIDEWKSRGYRNNMFMVNIIEPVVFPPWYGDPEFHAAHRSNLLRKAPEYYGKFGWREPTDLEYIWPV